MEAMPVFCSTYAMAICWGFQASIDGVQAQALLRHQLASIPPWTAPAGGRRPSPGRWPGCIICGSSDWSNIVVTALVDPLELLRLQRPTHLAGRGGPPRFSPAAAPRGFWPGPRPACPAGRPAGGRSVRAVRRGVAEAASGAARGCGPGPTARCISNCNRSPASSGSPVDRRHHVRVVEVGHGAGGLAPGICHRAGRAGEVGAADLPRPSFPSTSLHGRRRTGGAGVGADGRPRHADRGGRHGGGCRPSWRPPRPTSAAAPHSPGRGDGDQRQRLHSARGRSAGAPGRRRCRGGRAGRFGMTDGERTRRAPAATLGRRPRPTARRASATLGPCGDAAPGAELARDRGAARIPPFRAGFRSQGRILRPGWRTTPRIGRNRLCRGPLFLIDRTLSWP